MLEQAKAQVKATEKLLRWNRKTLDDAKAVVEIFKHGTRTTKNIAAACKHLRAIRSNHQWTKSNRPR